MPVPLFPFARIGLLAASIFAASAASAQTAIKFSLDSKFEGPTAPFAVAIDKGYFKAEASTSPSTPPPARSSRSAASPPAPMTWRSATSMR